MLLLISFILFVQSVNIKGMETSVSLGDLANCTEFSAVTGYNYQTYFKIEDMSSKLPDADLLNIKLYVLATKDAHVLLSTVENPPATSNVYEIVLGAGANTFSEIRRKRKAVALKTIKRLNMLSPINVLPVQIRISKAGLIQVTVDNEEYSFLNATDKDPIPVQYISFSSWGASLSKWFYDCHRPGDGSDMQEVVKNLTAAERIYAHLFQSYDQNVSPEGLTHVDFQLEIIRTAYSTAQSSLTTRGIVRMNWTDPKLVWNKADYEGVDSVIDKNWYNKDDAEFPGVWIPRIYLQNGKGEYFKNFALDLSIKIMSDGTIMAKSHAIAFETWCSDVQAADFQNWPSDELTCDIMLGIQDPNIRLQHSEPQFIIIHLESFDQSEWHLLSVRLPNNTAMSFGEYTTVVDLTYQLKLRRNSLFYKRIFCGPLIGAYLCILLSYWCRGFIRATLNLLGTLITSLMFIIMADYAPISYVPKLIIYYEWSLWLSWISFMVFVIDCCLEKYTVDMRPFDWLSTCINMTWLRLALGMDISNAYNRLLSKECPWYDIRQCLNRIVFLLLSVLGIAAVISGI